MFRCPVCGFPQLSDEPWNSNNSPSDEICPSCGTHFGYDDAGPGLGARAELHRELRSIWIANGCKWWSSRPAPPDWNPQVQLEQLNKTPAE